jgi:hypothetical protein
MCKGLGCKWGELVWPFLCHSGGEWGFHACVKGKLLHTLKDHAHWVTTLALNTDFVLRTGPFDHTSKRPSSDSEGLFFLSI